MYQSGLIFQRKVSLKQFKCFMPYFRNLHVFIFTFLTKFLMDKSRHTVISMISIIITDTTNEAHLLRCNFRVYFHLFFKYTQQHFSVNSEE